MSRGEGIVVREARKEDLESLLDLYLGFYSELLSRQGVRPHDKEEYWENVKRFLSCDKVFLAETSSGEAVGFIWVSGCEGWLLA